MALEVWILMDTSGMLCDIE